MDHSHVLSSSSIGGWQVDIIAPDTRMSVTIGIMVQENQFQGFFEKPRPFAILINIRLFIIFLKKGTFVQNGR
jgi:hypothetical protein